MRTPILIAIFVSFSTLAMAQAADYRPFKFDIGLGYAVPSSSPVFNNGVSFSAEPEFLLSNDLGLGLRVEGVGFGNQDEEGDTNVSILLSYCANAEYYLSDNTFRPFIGFGAGAFEQVSNVGVDEADSGTTTASSVGFIAYPEVGFEIGHLRFVASYNVATQKNSYFTVSLGAFFGGGRK